MTGKQEPPRERGRVIELRQAVQARRRYQQAALRAETAASWRPAPGGEGPRLTRGEAGKGSSAFTLVSGSPGETLEKRRRRGGRRRLRFRKTALLLLGLLLFLGGWPLLRFFRENLLVRTAPARIGVVEEVLLTEGVLVREERVLAAPIPGEVELLVPEGKVVPAGTPLVRLINRNLERQIAPRLAAVDKRLVELAKTEAQSQEEYQRQLTDLQLDLAQHQERLEAALKAKAFLTARQQGDILAQKEEERQNLLAALAEEKLRWEEQRESLLREKEATQKRLASAVRTLTAPEPGRVSFHLDGLEGWCSPANYLALTREGVRELQPAVQVTLAGARVAVGAPLARLTKTLQYYLAFSLARVPASWRDLAEGAVIQIRLGEGKEGPLLKTRLIRRGTAEGRGGTETVFLVALPGYRRQWDYLRRTPLQVVVTHAEGVVAPRRALIKQEGTSGVWVRTEGGRLFKPVRVLGGNREEVALEGVPEGQAIILNP